MRRVSVVGFPLLVFFGDAVGDKITVEGFDNFSAETFGFGPVSTCFEDRGDAVRGGDVGGAGFEFRGGADIGDAIGDERDDLAIDGVHAGADFVKGAAAVRRDLGLVHGAIVTQAEIQVRT